MKDIIFIHEGDEGLRKAKAALETVRLPCEAHGWASDIQRVRPQIRVRSGDLAKTLNALQANEVKHFYIEGQQIA